MPLKIHVDILIHLNNNHPYKLAAHLNFMGYPKRLKRQYNGFTQLKKKQKKNVFVSVGIIKPSIKRPS